MEEKNTEEQKKVKPEIYKLAIWSPALTILGVILPIAFILLFKNANNPIFKIILPFSMISPFIGFSFGIISYYKITKSNGKYYGRLFAGLGITIPIFLFLITSLLH